MNILWLLKKKLKNIITCRIYGKIFLYIINIIMILIDTLKFLFILFDFSLSIHSKCPASGSFVLNTIFMLLKATESHYIH